MDNQNQTNPPPPVKTDDNQPPRPAFQTIEQPVKDSSPFAPTASTATPQTDSTVPANVQNTNTLHQSLVAEEQTDQQPEKKGFTPKTIFAGIVGLLVLTGGLIGGVLLVRQPQDIREEAASGAECTHASNCVLLEDPGNQGTYSTSEPIAYVDITAKDYHRYDLGNTNDGCYQVSIAGKNLSWERIGNGPNCKDISNIQVWLGQEQSTPSPSSTASPVASPTASPVSSPTASPVASPTASPVSTPTTNVSARCSEIRAYDEDWTQLSYQELSKLSADDVIRFTVSGVSDSGRFDKARFTINGVQRAEVTQQKPGTNEFYDEYVIPEETLNFTVNAQVHHTELDKWF